MAAGKVGTIGQSLGALSSYGLAATEPSVQVMVAGAPTLAAEWLYPITPMNLAPAFGDRAILLIAGADDSLTEPHFASSLLNMLESSQARLEMIDSGHRLSDEYVPLALEWIRQELR